MTPLVSLFVLYCVNLKVVYTPKMHSIFVNVGIYFCQCHLCPRSVMNDLWFMIVTFSGHNHMLIGFVKSSK